MPDKKTISQASSLLGKSGISGKTISNILGYRHGSVDVIEITCSDATVCFIKISQGGFEIGGTNEVGTGTQIAPR